MLVLFYLVSLYVCVWGQYFFTLQDTVTKLNRCVFDKIKVECGDERSPREEGMCVSVDRFCDCDGITVLLGDC